MDIDDMPNEILSNIFQFLSPESLTELEKVRCDYEEIIGRVFFSRIFFSRQTANFNVFKDQNKIWERVTRREHRKNRLWRDMLNSKHPNWECTKSFRALAIKLLGIGFFTIFFLI